MKIGILGSTGRAGQRIARLLARVTPCDLVLFGRNSEKLASIHKEIADATPKSVQSTVIDVLKNPDLDSAFKGLDLLIIAISSASAFETILQAALTARVDCLDIFLSSAKKSALLETKREAFLKEGLCYITDGGYHPGVPAAMVRNAEKLCPGLVRADVFGSFGVNWRETSLAQETIVDFVRELTNMKPSAFINGKWVTSWKNVRRFDFGDDIGVSDCFAMEMNEMRLLPEKIPALRQTGFYIAGFGWMMDWIVMPLLWGILKAFPVALPFTAKLFIWSLRHFAGQNNWALLNLDGQSITDKISIQLFYPDSYEMTALPVVACVKQYLDSPKRPGLWHQAHFVEPARFMEDLITMGVSVVCKTTPLSI